MNRPTRLLFIANDFPNRRQPTRGVFNLRLVQALANDNAVQVIAPVAWTSALPSGESRLSGGEAQTEFTVYHPRYYFTPKILRSYYGSFLWWSVRRTITRLLHDTPPDAVLGYWAHPDGEVAVRAARRAGVPAVVMVGGSDVLLLTKEPARRHCIVRVLHEADAVVTVSRHLQETLVQLGVPRAKIHIVPRGVDVQRFCPGDRSEARRRLGLPVEGNVLLWIGRMVPVKGLDVLLAACERLAVDTPFHLYLVGDGPLRPALQAECSKRGLSAQVHFVGAVAHDRLPDWYRAADVMVLPSRSEGIPNVLREASACGTPFVASRVGGVAEIAEEPSRLVPPDDPERLADGIRPLLTGPRAISSTRSRPLTWAESADQLLNVVRSLESGGRATDLPRIVTEHPTIPAYAGAADTPNPLRQFLKKLLAATLSRRRFIINGPAHSGAVCLTFDDGPHPEHTPRLLDVLRKEQVRATFFVVGANAARYPELVQRIVAEGHVVGNHTYTHVGPWNTSTRAMIDDVQRTRDLLHRLLGQATNLFRPPHGKLTTAWLWHLWRLRQTVVLWNRDPKDFACPAPALLRDWFRDNPLQAGDVVLLHDNRAHAAAVLPEVVATARERGMNFTTVREWIP